jgi:hypothetical protein
MTETGKQGFVADELPYKTSPQVAQRIYIPYIVYYLEARLPIFGANCQFNAVIMIFRPSNDFLAIPRPQY